MEGNVYEKVSVQRDTLTSGLLLVVCVHMFLRLLHHRLSLTCNVRGEHYYITSYFRGTWVGKIIIIIHLHSY